MDSRKIKQIEKNLTLITPGTKKKTRPFFCDVCGFAMSTFNDFSSYDALECCDFCAKKWAEKNREKWVSGWRPEKEDILKNKKERKQKTNSHLS